MYEYFFSFMVVLYVLASILIVQELVIFGRWQSRRRTLSI